MGANIQVPFGVVQGYRRAFESRARVYNLNEAGESVGRLGPYLGGTQRDAYDHVLYEWLTVDVSADTDANQEYTLLGTTSSDKKVRTPILGTTNKPDATTLLGVFGVEIVVELLEVSAGGAEWMEILQVLGGTGHTECRLGKQILYKGPILDILSGMPSLTHTGPDGQATSDNVVGPIERGSTGKVLSKAFFWDNTTSLDWKMTIDGSAYTGASDFRLCPRLMAFVAEQ